MMERRVYINGVISFEEENLVFVQISKPCARLSIEKRTDRKIQRTAATET